MVTDMDKLVYLNKFRREVSVVTEISEQVRAAIPGSWAEVFGTGEMQGRVQKMLNIWKENVCTELPETLSYLEQNLKTLELITYQDKFFALYGIQMGTGETDYYEGGNPLDCKAGDLFAGMPEKLKCFYESVHNGFYYYPGKSGIVSMERVTRFGESDWGILDDLEEPLQINLDSTYGFYNNGGGVYIAVDYQDCDNDKAVIWYTDEEPMYDVRFWEEVDEWLTASFE